MKQKNSSNDFTIQIKTDDTDSWADELKNIFTPSTVQYTITSFDTATVIKKITWDFGNGNKHKTITNRKQELIGHPMNCKYKKAHDTTLTIQASVYTEVGVFVTLPFHTITVNEHIKKHYVDPETFKNQIVNYYETGDFSDEMAESVSKIANGLAFASNFINYTYREDMIGDAVIRMVEALSTQKFDPAKGNPFSYFTKIAFNAFCNRIKKEKRIREALVKYQDTVYNDMVGDGVIPNTQGSSDHPHDSSYHHEDN